MWSTEEYLEAMESSPVYDVAIRTPLIAMPGLTESLGNAIWVKREDLQPVRSFKIRGAYQKIQSLTTEEKSQGIIAVSAGNHAQGVALSAKRMAIDATIVMPKTTPEIKVNGVRQYGATVVLHGNTYDEASAHAKKIAETESRIFIHPYDDPHVIAGQGTIGKELWEELPSMDKVFIAVGGGGLISGIALYLKTRNPSIQIIGVEAEDSACLTAALAAKERVTLPQVGIFADGVAVKQIGEEPFRLCQSLVDTMVTVTTDEICAAIKDIYDDSRAIAEPAGALGIAGIKKYLQANPTQNETLVTLNCGANVNFDRLRHVAERAEIGEGKEALYAVTIPEKPGSFRRFCQILGQRHVTEFNYRFNDAKDAHVFVGVQLDESTDQQKILEDLKKEGFQAIDLTHNELAILHIRHMVGGPSKDVTNERLFRFQFPESPGALLNFLNRMGENWNISLFHYRNHGAAYGRVLAGLQIPRSDTEQFSQFLTELGYTYFEETDNPVNALFL